MKKGFTLIELLAVIILLAVIALIAYPTLNNVISKNKDKLYTKQIEELKRHANTWVMGNSETFELENGESYLLTFEEMYKYGLIQDKEVKDPRNSDNIPGCMVITRNSTNYDIKYSENCKATYDCTFDGDLVQGAEYVDGQYTYRYMQQGGLGSWINISDDGWGVQLTDWESTKPVTSKICSTINNKPIVSMAHMYFNSNATSIDLSSIDTSNVTDMDSMFAQTKTKELNFEHFDTSKVTNMWNMFMQNEAIELDLSSFDTSNVESMRKMFDGCSATSINLSSFNTSKVTNMQEMFLLSNASELDLTNFDTSNVTNMRNMFGSSKAETIKFGTKFNTSKVTSMNSMFSNIQAKELDLSNFNTSNVTDMGYMFSITKLTMIDLSNFDTSNVTDMSNMFLLAEATTGYAKTQADADKFNGSSGKPTTLTFTVK